MASRRRLTQAAGYPGAWTCVVIDDVPELFGTRGLVKIRKYGAEMPVAGSNAEPAEGGPPNSTVVIRFADTEAAWGFLNDPGYQPVKEIRLSTTSRAQMVIAPEFTAGG